MRIRFRECNYAYMILGITVACLGPLMPHFIEEFGLRYREGGLLLLLQAGGNMTASTLGGYLSDRLGRNRILVAGTLMFLLAFGGLIWVQQAVYLYPIALLMGFAWGIYNFGINGMVNEMSHGDGSKINILHTFFAVGALSAPFIVSFSGYVPMGWRILPLLLLMMGIVMLWRMLKWPAPVSQTRQQGRQAVQKQRLPRRLLVFMMILFLYVGSESSVNGWVITYLSDLGIVTTTVSQYFLSFFWLVMIVSRLTVSRLVMRYPIERLLWISGTGALISYIAFLYVPFALGKLLFIVLLGLFFGGIYPLTIANASRSLQRSDMLMGLLMSVGGMGGALIPYLTGFVADAAGLAVGMQLVILFCMALLGVTIWNAFIREPVQPEMRADQLGP